jgi:cell division protein FtsQ
MKHSRPMAEVPQPVAVGLAPRRVWRLIIVGFGSLLIAAAAVWATALGLPQRLIINAATASAGAGFGVRQVQLSGVDRQPRIDIYREVLSGGSDAMILLDPADLRTRLNALPWVADSEVRRQWPDTVRIDIVERQPIAIWQQAGRYRLIDRNGKLLPPAPLEEFRKLPLVVGPGAEQATAGLLDLLKDHGGLASGLVGAVRVGGRRWDLKMQSGETIALPPDGQAPAALARFAAAQGMAPILGQGFLRIDLRIEGKMAVRLSPEAQLEADRRKRAAEKERAEAARMLKPATEVRI